MIKARLEGKDGAILLIGLSRANLERLLADEPIHFNASEAGMPPMEIAIIGGETEIDMANHVSDTIVRAVREMRSFTEPGSGKQQRDG
jgi:hypothetical protein